MFRVYLSNIRSQWPITRQERALSEAVPDWRDHPSYRDSLSIASRTKTNPPPPLPQRDNYLLKKVGRTRGDGTRVLIAALPVIAWTPTDFISVLMRLAARHEQLQTVAENLVIDPTTSDMNELQGIFYAATRRFAYRGLSGGEASGQQRHAKVLEKLKLIEPYWKLSDSQYSNAWICREFNISRPTLLKWMPNRAREQARYNASLNTSVANRLRAMKAKEEEEKSDAAG